MQTDADHYARIVWDYLRLGQSLKKCDAIFVLCSSDTRVAERAAELFLGDYGEHTIFSGKWGDTTQGLFDGSEADAFAKIAMQRGVPQDKILIEGQSTNTGENIQFTYQLLRDKKLHPTSLLLVQKPYMERRTYATFKKQWPNPGADIIVTSPQIEYDNYFNEQNPKETVLNIMVGDMQRIQEYAKLGFQIEQDIPAEVWTAYEQLVKLGYDKRLIKT
jgi:uncharacterized SAM-binding protein YcdF (DUF218 family)